MVTDKTGREIKVGDCIAYIHQFEKSATMHIGRVTKVTENIGGSSAVHAVGVNDDWLRFNTYSIKIQHPKNTIVLNEVPDKYKEWL